jgi:subtilisin-like proprotein convertase family protein
MANASLSYRYGGKKGKRRRLVEDEGLLVVRTKSRRPLRRSVLGKPALALLESFESVVQYEDAGVEVLRTRVSRGRSALRDKARRALSKASDVQFAGRVLTDYGSGSPVLYTENLFVKFWDDVRASAAKKTLKSAGLKIEHQLEYAHGAYFVKASEGTGRKVFALASRLLNDKLVELCHPELIRPRAPRVAAPQQWHLKKATIDGNVINQHANVVTAWAVTEGEGVTIAIIDDGVDIDHLDFAGAGKVVHPRDVTRGVSDGRPFLSTDRHGTACAGVACSSGQFGSAGVAPKAKLMPIRLRSALGSQSEADAFFWAAQHGADVISCSWGPTDGRWWDANDPQHNVVVDLPDSTRLAIDWAANNGRNGKGCVITWAAGNGNESVDNDGYAAYTGVIAVAACSDRGKRSVYSDKGDAVWCAFPSSDFTDPELTPGIWTTDRSGGSGYNPGAPNANGDAAGNYTQDFGGTSSACPGAAGVAALVIARNPDLRWDEVKDVLKRCCTRIDDVGNEYDANGHSKQYGYGRLDARKAVQLAVPPTPKYSVLHEARQDVAIKDHKTSKIRVEVGDTQALKEVEIHVDIEHTYIGDLVVTVKTPSGAAVTLHDKAGGTTNNLRKTYDAVNAPGLTALVGTTQTGTWTLEVKDTATADKGKVVRFGVELSL